VIEGDEYDSAYFDKTAKFLKYLPDIAVVNNVEFDHADIYADFDAVTLAFRRLVNLVPRRGLLLVGSDSPGAKALVVFMAEHARAGEAWRVLRQVQADETHNCAIVGKLLERAGADYSHATGEFYDKAIAVTGRRRRIEFLVRGLRWAVREFEQALERIGDVEAQDALVRMRDSHLRSIAACEALARSLSD